MLVVPLISCGARLPVYVLLLGALFPSRAVLSVGGLSVTNQALLLFGIYVTGIVLAVVCAKLLRMTVLGGEVTPLVIELPPYRRPTARSLVLHMWERGWQYLKKAGTVILAIVLVLWAAQTWPSLPADQRAAFDHQREAATAASADTATMNRRLADIGIREHQAQLMNSAIGRLGRFVAPVLAPCGLDWRVATALIGALGAKEVFVGQLGVIYATGDDATQAASASGGGTLLQDRIRHDYTPLQGLCMMLLVLIASPCAATVAVTARESGTWKWAALQWSYLTVLAYLIATAAFQLGHAMGMG
jgi:ferrous iron transport protein B